MKIKELESLKRNTKIYRIVYYGNKPPQIEVVTLMGNERLQGKFWVKGGESKQSLADKSDLFRTEGDACKGIIKFFKDVIKTMKQTITIYEKEIADWSEKIK